MDPYPHIEKLFGADDSGYIPPHNIVHVLKLAWSGGLPSDGVRAICWRVLLGLISPSDKCLWEKELSDMIESYSTVKATVLPSLDKVAVDPLSSLSSGESQSNEWSIYYKNVDLINFIKTDLDRLYITGIPDEYFESPKRRDMLLAILLIWSFDHPVISYRQGMHEMAGYVMFCVETELAAFNALRATGTDAKPANDSYGLLNVINEQSVEANTYHLFVRIMNELEPLYDPVSLTPRGAENQPFVVQFSTKVQEHYLRQLDSELCHHLEECHISAQIYGLRWCRLLLGREFTSENGLLFRLWDYMFACCYEAEHMSNEALLDIDARPNHCSVFTAVRVQGHTQHTNEVRRNTSSLGTVKHESPNESSAPAVPNYECTPLLGALGDMMLAMMLNMRDQMMEGDSSTVLGLLMHYPPVPSATPILDYADMIKRGVIMDPHAQQHHKQPNKKLPPPHNVPLRLASTNGHSAGSGSNSTSGAPSPSPANSMTSWTGMKQKLMAAATAMGNGLTEIVNNIAEMTEDDETHPHSGHAHHPRSSTSTAGAPGATSHADSAKTKRPSTTKSLFGSPSPHGSVAKGEKKTESPATHTTSTAPASVSAAPATFSDAPPSVPATPSGDYVYPSDPLSAENNVIPATSTAPESSSVKSDNPLSLDDEVPPSGSTRSQSALSDPLSLLLAPGDSSTPSPVPQTLFEPSSPKLTGMGTGYKNMPADVVQPDDRDPFHLTKNPVNAADLAALTSPSLRSTFFTKEWLPGSTVKKDKHPRRENRSSGGVDLHVMHTQSNRSRAAGGTESSSDVDRSDSDTEGLGLSNKLRSVRPQVDRNAVGDRLLDLAESLANPAYRTMPSAFAHSEELDHEVAMRRDAVKKLRVIADVLAGLVSLQDFDTQFPAAKPAHALSPMPASRNKASVASPLPPVREKSESVDVPRLSFEIEPQPGSEPVLELKTADEAQLEEISTQDDAQREEAKDSTLGQETSTFVPLARSGSEELDVVL